MAFDYEAAKAQYGAQRAREMEREASMSFPDAPSGAPAAPAPIGIPAPAGARPAVGPSSTSRGPAPVGGGPAPLTGAGAALEQNMAAQRGNTDWRDTNVSSAQWGAWEEEERKRFENGTSAQQTTPGGCPPDKPFTGRGGQCAYKPDDCPDGTVVQGSDTNGTAKCVPAGGGGGGQGFGAAGGGPAAATTGAGSTDAFAKQLQDNLSKMMSGENSRYNPQAVQGLLAEIKQRIESSKNTQVRQAQEEAAGRGMSRSGVTGTNLAAIRRGAESQFTSEYSGVLKSKIDADYQDKLAAIDRSQKYLDSMRDELYRRDMSAIQRQQFQANLDLAYANIAYQREALASQQQYGKDMLAAQYGYGATFGG